MRTLKSGESQIVVILKKPDGGVKVSEICRKYAILSATYYKTNSQ